MFYFKVLSTLFVLTVLGFVLTKTVNISDLQGLIINFPKSWLGLFLGISILITLLKVWRFLILLKEGNIKISFWNTLKVFVASQAITPLPGGEAARGVLVHKETGDKAVKITGPVLVQAFLEVLGAATLAALGSIFYEALRTVSVVFFLTLLAFGTVILNRKLQIILFKVLPEFSVIRYIKQKMQALRTQIIDVVIDKGSGLPDKTIVKAFSLSLVTNILGGLLIYLIAYSYESPLGILQSIFLYSASVVISGASTIAPGGLGFTEGGMAGLLIFFNQPWDKTLGIIVVFRAVTLAFAVFSGLIFLSVFYGKGFFRWK